MREERQSEQKSSRAEERQLNSGSDTSTHYKALVKAYRASKKPVDVDFRALVDWVRLGDQLTHQIHPYPAKLLPLIAHFFAHARCLAKPSSVVLDPFCGSGTVALEASLAGHVPHVADANPFAALLTKVKTTAYDIATLDRAKKSVVSSAKRYKSAPKIPIVNEHLWYSARVKRELEKILRAVTAIDDISTRMFFELCFSNVARRLSYADPAISVPVRMKVGDRHSKVANKKIRQRLRWLAGADVVDEFAKVCNANIRRVEITNQLLPCRKPAIQVSADAKELSSQSDHRFKGVADKSVPLIITSPPYGSAQKYIRSSSLSLNWLKMAAPSDLAAVESLSIGREHVSRSRELKLVGKLPESYRNLLDRIEAKNANRRRITELYLYELRDALLEMNRVAKVGGHIVIVIGNNQVCGETLWNDSFVCEVMRKAGLQLELSLLDTIKSRGLMTKRNKTASMISREAVLVFKKVRK